MNRKIFSLLTLYLFLFLSIGVHAETPPPDSSPDQDKNNLPIITKEKTVVIKKKAPSEAQPSAITQMFGVKAEVWKEGFKFIPTINDSDAFLKKWTSLEDEWYLEDMLESVGRPSEKTGIYMYHKRFGDSLRFQNKELVSANLIVITTYDADQLTSMLFYAYKNKSDMTEDQAAKLMVYSSGAISKGLSVNHVVTYIQDSISKNKSVDDICQHLQQMRKYKY